MKNNKTILALALALVFGLVACAQMKKGESKMNENVNKHVLVAYFSATGTTKEAATQLAKAANADLYEIVPEKPYTSADLDWNDDNSRSSVEMKNPKSRPVIKGKVENLGQYDTVYVGFPIWWYTAPTIINTFVESNDLKGKTVITFATSGGSTVTKATKDLKAAYPGINWKEGSLLNGRTLQEAKALVGKVK